MSTHPQPARRQIPVGDKPAPDHALDHIQDIIRILSFAEIRIPQRAGQRLRRDLAEFPPHFLISERGKPFLYVLGISKLHRTSMPDAMSMTQAFQLLRQANG